MRRTTFISLALCLLVAGRSFAAADALIDKVDRIFAEWNTTSSPGCALAVVKDGHIIYEHDYGMANLELSVAITPQSVFDIGSVSKQITALAMLLGNDNKISWSLFAPGNTYVISLEVTDDHGCTADSVGSVIISRFEVSTTVRVAVGSCSRSLTPRSHEVISTTTW